MRSRVAESPVVSKSKTTNSASSSTGSAVTPAREIVVPEQASLLSPAVTSARSEQASPVGIEVVAKSDRAASTADREPCSSSLSTRPSSASSESCIHGCKRTYVRISSRGSAPHVLRQSSGAPGLLDRAAAAEGGSRYAIGNRGGSRAAPAHGRRPPAGRGRG